jgi:NADH-quinone oxidoreductase subunit M
MGGLWWAVPKLSGVALFFAVASLGLPGLGNFVGEFLVVLGTFQTNAPMAVVATLGLIASAIYSLWMIQVAFQGQNAHKWKLPDITRREAAILASMAAIAIWLGVYPQSILATTKQSVHNLQQIVSTYKPSQTTQAPENPPIVAAEAKDGEGR